MRTQTKPYKLLSLVLSLLFLVNIVAPVIVTPVMAQETKTIQIHIRDEDNLPLNDVTVYVYTSAGGSPPTPGPLYAIITIDSGDYYTLPMGAYFLEPAKEGYVTRYPKENMYISEGVTTAYLYMVSAPEVGHPVTLRAIDENTGFLIPDVTFKIYRCMSAPPYAPIGLIRTIHSASGEAYITDLPKDYYCVEVVKEGYSHRYPMEESRFDNYESSSTINIIMETEREPSFLDQCIEGIANLFGVSFDIGKIILGMLLALGIGTATAKHLRGGAQEFGLGMLGGVVLGVLIGLLPVWVMVLLVLIVGLWIGKRYMDGGD